MKRLWNRLFNGQPEKRAEVSTLRTVTSARLENLPPLSMLDATRPDDTIIPLVLARPKRATEAPVVIPDEKVIGVACCSECKAELVVCCPNGHEGADLNLRDLIAPPSAPPVDEERKNTLSPIVPKGPKPPLVCRCGAVVPRKNGRPPRNPQCDNCKAKVAA